VFHWPVDAVLLEFGVDGLREAGLHEANRLRALDAEKLFQVRRPVMLHHGVMLEVRQDFRADGFRNVLGDQHEVQLALVGAQRVTADEQNPRPQDERKQSLDRSA